MIYSNIQEVQRMANKYNVGNVLLSTREKNTW